MIFVSLFCQKHRNASRIRKLRRYTQIHMLKIDLRTFASSHITRDIRTILSQYYPVLVFHKKYVFRVLRIKSTKRYFCVNSSYLYYASIFRTKMQVDRNFFRNILVKWRLKWKRFSISWRRRIVSLRHQHPISLQFIAKKSIIFSRLYQGWNQNMTAVNGRHDADTSKMIKLSYSSDICHH